MKHFLIILLVVTTLATAGWGFVVMDHSGTDHSNCLAATASGVDCAQILNPIDLVMMHANFLSQFTNTVFAKSIALALFFISLFYLVGFKQKYSKDSFSFYKRRANEPVWHSKSQFEHWFALHENSPSFVLGRL